MWKRLEQLWELQRQLGFGAGLKWYVIRSRRFNHFGKAKVSIHPKSLSDPLIVRLKDRSSDVEVFNDIFVERELAGLLTLLQSQQPRVVIDLGANVGYTSLFFLNSFPNSFVLAVEPDPDNANMCRQNLKPYGKRVKVVEGAVWPVKGKLSLSRGTFGDGRAWATEVREAKFGEAGDVEAWDVPSLIDLCPQSQIDLLKIDIEGSETALFSAQACGWLKQVRTVCIEVHGPDCEQAVRSALRGYDYVASQIGEYQIYSGLESNTVR